MTAKYIDISTVMVYIISMELGTEQKRKSVFSGELCRYGLKVRQDIVRPFPRRVLNRLRPFLLGGVPANILIALNEMCSGECYERAKLATLAFDECDLVHAKINSFWTAEDGYKYAGHAFVENGGKVYDTTAGLVFDKGFYYNIEQPKIEEVFTKAECMKDTELRSIIANDTETDKYALPLLLPSIENMLEKSTEPTTKFYKPYILRELDIHKKGINYEEFLREERENMKLSQTDPAALDRKLGILRDEYGREISRNGIANQYYYVKPEQRKFISFEDLVKYEKLRKSELLGLISEEYIKEIDKVIDEEKETEQAQIFEKAQKRLSKIAARPSAFAFEIDRE